MMRSLHPNLPLPSAALTENMPDPLHAFIIHLERNRERASQVKILQETLPQNAYPITVQIIPAIDGQKLKANDISQAYCQRLHRPLYPFLLSNNEIACFLSHRRVWRTLIEQNLQAALVVEDDVTLLPVFHSVLTLALDVIHEENYFVRFPARAREKGKLLVNQNGISLISPCPVGLGTQMYLISRRAAQYLLSATAPFDRPIDVMLQMFWHTKVRPLCVLPSGIEEHSVNLGGSTIQQKRRGLEKLYREIMRPLYRGRIAFMSARHASSPPQPLYLGGCHEQKDS